MPSMPSGISQIIPVEGGSLSPLKRLQPRSSDHGLYFQKSFHDVQFMTCQFMFFLCCSALIRLSSEKRFKSIAHLLHGISAASGSCKNVVPVIGF
jgi:hypothetical protein